LAAHVVELAAVDEADKAWLYQHAAAVLFPSTVEGFGLVPFEAAQAGRPCLFAHVSALRDVLPAETATLVPWDPAASADRVLPVITEPQRAAALVEAIRAAAEPLTWDRCAGALLDVYEEALRLPAPPALRNTHRVARVEHDYWALHDALGGPARALVGPADPLLETSEQRVLGSLLRRRFTRRPLHALLGLGARLLRRD
jgi:hypothetical protein